MADDASIFRALEKTASTGCLLLIHAENGSVIEVLTRQALAEGKTAPLYHALTRPAAAEAEAVYRSVCLARMAGAPVYIVHLSTKPALEHVARARAEGLPVLAETCPQYLLLSEDDIRKPGFEGAKFVFTPPPRERSNQEKLWEGLREGTLQVVSTDHCPFRFRDQKSLGMHDFTKIPNGGPGIENRMQLLFDRGVNAGRLSLNRWVEVTSTAPAKIFGLYPRKGALLAGSDADIVLWDPRREHVISASTHHMRVDYSMYEGFRVTGNAHTVFSRGELIVKDGTWTGRAGRGIYLRREVYRPARS
jgi:dihydropyrimidinase